MSIVQPAIICSKLTMEAIEQSVKYVLVSLLLTLSKIAPSSSVSLVSSERVNAGWLSSDSWAYFFEAKFLRQFYIAGVGGVFSLPGCGVFSSPAGVETGVLNFPQRNLRQPMFQNSPIFPYYLLYGN